RIVAPAADIDGYVPEEGDDMDDFRWDAAVEWDEDAWDEHVARAVELTAAAEGAIAEWRRVHRPSDVAREWLWTGGYALPCERCGTPQLTDEEERGVCDDCVTPPDVEQ